MKRGRCKWCDKLLSGHEHTLCKPCLKEYEIKHGIKKAVSNVEHTEEK